MSAAAAPHSMPALPQDLPTVWRASELCRRSHATRASGHPELDAQLPGGGWPQGGLTEILQVQPGLHEWRLLLPALRALQSPIVLVGAPHLPFLAALEAMGLPPDQMLLVQSRAPIERLWACEQALRCGQLGALLAWLPQVRSEQLRRIQLACSTTEALVFAMRPDNARHESSPAPLRLQLQRGPGLDLAVHLFKRKGPPLEAPLQLVAPLPVWGVLRKSAVPQSSKDLRDAVDRPGRAQPGRHPLYA